MGGVSSFIRGIGIRPLFYQRLIDFFHRDAIDLCKLTELWGKAVFKLFQPFLVTLRGCPVFVLDGISIAKEGKKCQVFNLSTRHQIATPRPNISWDIFFNVLASWPVLQEVLFFLSHCWAEFTRGRSLAIETKGAFMIRPLL